MAMRRFIAEAIKIVGTISVPLTFFNLVAYPSHVEGTSMEPTIHHGDVVWVSRLFVHSPSVGDIYCFVCPADLTKTHMKRVAALAGQTVLDHNNDPLKVSENHLWMRSDNVMLDNAWDSRHYGEVNYDLLRGKAVCIIWPPTRWKSLRRHAHSSN